VPDARDIGDGLATRGIKLSLGGQLYDPTDSMGKMFFNILATFAEFEVDVLRMRTREGMAVARAKGRLKGRKPKLTTKQQTELRRMHCTGDYTIHRPRRTVQHFPTHRLPHPRSSGNVAEQRSRR
jgi:DNA invertase Pin-like site-specific DNA recombinase